MKRKQIVFIHGAMVFRNDEAFLEYLEVVSIDDPLGDSPKRWKNSLREDLGERYEVFLPAMPNKQNAKHEEWKIWFERHFPFLRDDVVLIGHSQGGYFLAKYLSENSMPVRVRALYFLAAPIKSDSFGSEDGGDFQFDTAKLSPGAADIRDVFIFHSKDDPVVPYKHALKYKEALPSAHLVTLEGRGHFLTEEFPELLESIRAVKM